MAHLLRVVLALSQELEFFKLFAVMAVSILFVILAFVSTVLFGLSHRGLSISGRLIACGEL